jgi:phosphoribosylaminoimidazolecarboxamide formyltransferase/IMP cyclohydrolase
MLCGTPPQNTKRRNGNYWDNKRKREYEREQDTVTTMAQSPANSDTKTHAASSSEQIRVRRAILSAYDKTGLVDLAKTLRAFDVEIISTGGTMKVLDEAGIPVTSVESITGYGSMLGGRLKTLHPKLMGGILARMERDDDRQELKDAGFNSCELVVVNLYPFSKAADNPSASLADAIELIDVGGPTMIRAAAKNHSTLTVVCDPSDYPALAQELNDNEGSVTAETRQRLAVKAFATTAAYDAKIASHLSANLGADKRDRFPNIWIQQYAKTGSLRYGENPHQEAAVYRLVGEDGPSLATAPVVGNKELSYNNYGDLDAAWRMAADFTEPFAAVFKHANPCGAAIGDTLRAAYEAAYATDPLSAYGSIIALNRTVDLACAEALHETQFIECVVAPGYDPDALELLRKKKARRYVTVPTMDLHGETTRFRELVGGLLVQDEDMRELTEADLTVATERKPTAAEIQSLLFARKVVKHSKSNAIVLVQGNAAVGIGAGQTSRVDAVRSAVERAGDRAKGAALASDAFFPMRDGPEVAAKAGVVAIIQPGGSKRDQETIDACNEHGIAMVFSGMRNFRH